MMRSKAKLKRSDVSCFSQFCGACFSTENMISWTVCYWVAVGRILLPFLSLVHAQRQFLRCDPLFLGIKSKLISVSLFLSFRRYVLSLFLISFGMFLGPWRAVFERFALCQVSEQLKMALAQIWWQPLGSGGRRVEAVPTHPSLLLGFRIRPKDAVIRCRFSFRWSDGQRGVVGRAWWVQMVRRLCRA